MCGPWSIHAYACSSRLVRDRELEGTLGRYKVSIVEKAALDVLGVSEEFSVLLEVGLGEGEKRSFETTEEIHCRGP